MLSTSALGNNVWHHVAVTWDNSAEYGKVYVNTVLDGSYDFHAAHPEAWYRFVDNDCNVLLGAKVSETFIEDPNRHKIGSCPCDAGGYANSFFKGYLSDARMYKRVLTADEVKYLAGGEYIPLESEANIWDEELPGFKSVNFMDFAILGEEWLQ
jgi:hypothetical protein